MLFCQNMMTGEKIRGKENKIMQKLQNGSGTLNVYVIAICEGEDLFEIYNAGILKQRGLRKLPIRIAGLASSPEEAQDMITGWIMEHLNLDNPEILKQKSLDYFAPMRKKP